MRDSGRMLALTAWTAWAIIAAMRSRSLTPFLRRLMLLASLVSLVPAAGIALCLGEEGHVAIELIAERCDPSLAAPGGPCDTECHDCEDIPLSIGIGERITVRQEFHGLATVDVCEAPSLICGSFGLAPCPTPRRQAIRPVSFASHPSPLRC